MKFFTYSQNNSGGFYSGPYGVIVEAPNQDVANALAESVAGVYFNGVRNGRDCQCCGDRWYPGWNEYDKAEDAFNDIYNQYMLDEMREHGIMLVSADGRSVLMTDIQARIEEGESPKNLEFYGE